MTANPCLLQSQSKPKLGEFVSFWTICWYFLHRFPASQSFIYNERENATKEVKYLLHALSAPLKSNPGQALLKTSECTKQPLKAALLLNKDTLTVTRVGRRQDHAVHFPHLLHLVGYLIQEASDLFHLAVDQWINQPTVSLSWIIVDQCTHPGSPSDTHPPEKALHEAISVHCDCNILLCLCPTLNRWKKSLYSFILVQSEAGWGTCRGKKRDLQRSARPVDPSSHRSARLNSSKTVAGSSWMCPCAD